MSYPCFGFSKFGSFSIPVLFNSDLQINADQKNKKSNLFKTEKRQYRQYFLSEKGFMDTIVNRARKALD